MTDIQRNLLIGLGIVVVVGAGLYFYAHRTTPVPAASDTTATTTPTVTDGISASGGYTVTEVVAPNYHAALKFDASTSPEVRTALNNQLATTVAALDKNKNSFDAWIKLGDIRKLAGDYSGAAEAWDYIAVVYPGNIITPNNLCDLYLNFLKNYPKAEVSCKKAIAVNSKNIDAYVNLYYLYHNYYKQGTGADTSTLDAGLKNNPGNSTLLALKAQG